MFCCFNIILPSLFSQLSVAGKETQWVKCSLCNHERLTWNTQNPQKDQAMWYLCLQPQMCVCAPLRRWEEGEEGPWTLTGQLAQHGDKEQETISTKGEIEEQHWRLTTCYSMYTHTTTHTHTSPHMRVLTHVHTQMHVHTHKIKNK